LCIFRCLARFEDSENALPQISHFRGLRPVWVRSWIAFCGLAFYVKDRIGIMT